MTNIGIKAFSGLFYPVLCGYINSDKKNPLNRRFVFYVIEYVDSTDLKKFRVRTEHNFEIPAPLEDFGDLRNSRLILMGENLTILTNKRVLRIYLKTNQMQLDSSKAPEIDQFIYCWPNQASVPESFVSIIKETGHYLLLRFVSSAGYFKSPFVGFINKKTRESSCLGNTTDRLHSFSDIQENRIGGDSPTHPV